MIMPPRLHHVGIVVPERSTAELIMGMFGLVEEREYYVARYDARCIFAACEGGRVEFVLAGSGALASFNKGMGGVHHVAFEVDDLDAFMDRSRLEGTEFLESQPVEAGPLRINFVAPAFTRGVVVEVVEDRGDTTPPKMPDLADTSPFDGLDRSLAEAEARYPSGVAVCREILALARSVLGPQAVFLARRDGERFFAEMDRLARLSKAAGGRPAPAVVEYTIEYLREQASYLATGTYRHQRFDTALEEVYSDPSVMTGFYLDGLLMTHAIWPIHVDLHAWYRDRFVHRVGAGSTGAEFGFGHGLYLLDVLQRTGARLALGYDISEHSIAYAGRIFASEGEDPSRFRLLHADLRFPIELESAVLDWGICAEVMEHVPDPLATFSEIARCLAPGAPLFVTTVLYSNAIDHLTQFADVGEVRNLLERAGLHVTDELQLSVRDYAPESRDPTVDLAFVCHRRA